MTNPRSKSDILSKTAIGVAEEWMKYQLYKKKHEFYSKETDKGNHCEMDSIILIRDHYGYNATKNTVTKENDWLIGTCDVDLVKDLDLVIDVKNSWSDQTFPLFEKEIPNKDYYAQGNGYMDLWGANNFSVIYTLNDAPDHIIESEARRKQYQLGYEEMELELYQQVEEYLKYSHYPIELRVKRFDFARNQEYIDSVHERVELVRWWIENETDFYSIYEKTIL